MEEETIFKKIFDWAFAVGCNIIQNSKCGDEKGRDYLRRLIFEIRAEETPGRFLDKLSETLGEYKTNINILAPVSLLPEIYQTKTKWSGDSFYYLKSSILSGLLNALSTK
ncbi:MAG: hypothetical protein NZ893_02690 [Candidatus Aenigmarchaeota archaeon]|nr:hypothetical protein [Candidatus Aenigmarchaeota archaeon]